MATVTQGHASMTFIDQSNKSSVQRLSCTTLIDTNIVAQTTAFQALVTATNNMSAGTLTKSLLGNLSTNTTPAIPVPPASRSDKFAVSYYDSTTGDKYTTQIPVANPTITPFLPGTRLLNLAVTPTSAYVTAFQAFVKSEEGNAAVITQIRWVGRHI